jgi:hypothetical protein
MKSNYTNDYFEQEKGKMNNGWRTDRIWKCVNKTNGSELTCNEFFTLLQQMKLMMKLQISLILQTKIKTDILVNKRSEFTIMDNEGKKYNIIIIELEAAEEPLDY